MAAAGKVLTGFSLPYVALYSESGGTITYSNGQKLARGVDVTVSPESSNDNIFYADNVSAESADGEFINGTVSLTVDGLLETAEKLIFGLPAADGDDWYHYGDSMTVPYVGIGFIARYMSDGVTSYVPHVLTKCRFNLSEFSGATQEDAIEWQTQALEARIFRDDSTNHDWHLFGESQATEADAENMIKTLFSI